MAGATGEAARSRIGSFGRSSLYSMRSTRSGGCGSKGITAIATRLALIRLHTRLPAPFGCGKELQRKSLKKTRKQLIRRRSTDMASIAAANSLFEIDVELDALLEEI